MPSSPTSTTTPTAGTAQFQAQGNIYNTLLYHGNTDSEITTLITGSGNDKIIGNDLDNLLNAGAGNDTIIAGTGDDIMIGGPGADSIYFHFGNGILSSGHDILRDTPADLNGDQVWGFGSGYTSALDVLGVQFGQIGLVVADDQQSATLSSGCDHQAQRHVHGRRLHDRHPRQRRSGAHDLQLRAVHAQPGGRQGRQFLACSTASPTSLSSPATAASTSRSPSTRPFRHSPTPWAIYQVSADGTIHDVRILFGNTHNAAAGQTIDLGVPNNNEHIGFFLIQDGFDQIRQPPQRPLLPVAVDPSVGKPEQQFDARPAEREPGDAYGRADLPLLR